MLKNRDTSIDLTIGNEGGYVNHPSDPGGATNLGVTIAVLGEWLGRKATIADVKGLTITTARAIYTKNYWNPAGCDLYPSGVDYLVFDMAVNAGVDRAKKLLQRAVGATEDGKIGPKTLAAINKIKPVDLVEEYSKVRMRFYLDLNKPVFIKGWLNRVLDTLTDAVLMTTK